MQPITIILTDRYSDWEIGHLAGLGGAFFGADLRFVSPSGGALRSVAGLPLSETARFEPQESGVVVICGSPVWEGQGAPDIGVPLRQSLANGCVLAGICGGTIALARAGLLDEVAHTSNGPGYLDQLVPGYRGQSRYVDQSGALRDGNLITAPAPAPASFAYEVLVAAGLDRAAAQQIPDMLAREHQA
ncbi:DJ-1/PfpI family protein [Devosia crocina]|uniref:DJ-1/PfpI family protein n=1 Tax=Devosia crocina TaxID=429728 RepID=A0A1I7NT08_9HYPH|nr:DJ-1/PfpI family protein [Devosia crocina]SFV37819.1 DJ-1/PfpI family protein [Devosia crocina]